MASLAPATTENVEAERNKMEKQLASLRLSAPNAHLHQQLTLLSDKDEENFDATERDNKVEKRLASLTLAAPNAHQSEDCDAMDCDQQFDAPSQLPTMKPESYRYLAALSNEEYEDLLKHTASTRL